MITFSIQIKCWNSSWNFHRSTFSLISDDTLKCDVMHDRIAFTCYWNNGNQFKIFIALVVGCSKIFFLYDWLVRTNEQQDQEMYHWTVCPVKIQVSLHIHTALSEYSLFCITKDSKFLTRKLIRWGRFPCYTLRLKYFLFCSCQQGSG